MTHSHPGHFFLSSGRWEGRTKVPAGPSPGEPAAFAEGHLLQPLPPPRAEEPSLSPLLLTTIIPPGGLPKAPTPNSITLGIKVLTNEFGENTNSVHSKQYSTACRKLVRGSGRERTRELASLTHRYTEFHTSYSSSVQSYPQRHLLHCTLAYTNPSKTITLNYTQCTSISHINYLSTLKNGGCNPFYFTTSALINNSQFLER